MLINLIKSVFSPINNQALTNDSLYSKDLATNMGKGDENLDQDVILKFIQVICSSTVLQNMLLFNHSMHSSV